MFRCWPGKWVMAVCVVVLCGLLSACSSGGGEDIAPTVQQRQQQDDQTTTTAESTVAHESVDEQKDDQTEVAEVDPSTARESVDEQRTAVEPPATSSLPAEEPARDHVFQLTDWPGNERGEWSPDGSRILIYGDSDSDEDSDLYVVDSDGSNLIQLTDWSGHKRGEWFPDSSRILIDSDRDSDGDDELYVVDVDGSSLVQLIDWPGYIGQIYLSPDGSRVLVDSDRDFDGGDELYVVDVDGSSLVQLIDWPGQIHKVYLSPDGSRMLIDGDRYSRGYCDQYMMDIDGSKLIEVTVDVCGILADWSLDSSRILITGSFVVGDNCIDVYYSEENGLPVDAFILKADGSELARLTDWICDILRVEWSSDGSRIFISGSRYRDDFYGRNGTFMIEASGSSSFHYKSDLVYLTDRSNHEQFLALSPDSSRMIIEGDHDEDGYSDVLVMDVDEPNLIRLIDLPGRTIRGAYWSPDGSHILVAGDYNLAVVRADGSNLVQLTDEFCDIWSVDWSPDSFNVLVTSDCGRNGRNLFVVSVHGSNSIEAAN